MPISNTDGIKIKVVFTILMIAYFVLYVGGGGGGAACSVRDSSVGVFGVLCLAGSYKSEGKEARSTV